MNLSCVAILIFYSIRDKSHLHVLISVRVLKSNFDVVEPADLDPVSLPFFPSREGISKLFQLLALQYNFKRDQSSDKVVDKDLLSVIRVSNHFQVGNEIHPT